MAVRAKTPVFKEKVAEVHGNRNSAENVGKTQVLSQGGAQSGALHARNEDCSPLATSQDADLCAVVEAWPKLSEAVKARILAMIRAVGDRA